MTQDSDDLMEMLGVVLPPPVLPQVRRRSDAPVRHTEWNNATSFEFGGYLAKVMRFNCKMCEGFNETLVGVFTEELHHRSGTRRLTLLVKGAQWPVNLEHRLEITEAEVEVCASCIRDLGFSREVDAKGQPWAMFVKG